WFHPLVWWATRWTSREAERCCDEAVVAELGCSPARYARCLFDVLKSKRVLRPLPAVPGVRPVEVTSKRMERIMRLGQGSHKRSPLWCWAVMALAAVVALPGAALVMSADEESASPDARSEWLAPAYLSAPGGKDRPEAAPLLGTARLGRLRTGRETAFHDRDPQSHTSRKYAAGHLIRAARSALDLDDVEARQLLRQIVSGEMAWAGLRTALHPERTNEEPSVAWSGDRLLVRASRRQHERIAEALRVMKTHSFSQITVEARWITGPASIIDALEVDWPVSLAEVPAGDPLELPSTTLDPAPGDTSTAPGRALTGREKNLPATFAILDAQQVTALLGRLQELGASEPENTGGLRKAVRRVLGYNDQHNGEVNVLQAPKVTVFNGQKAFINDCSQSPLVVSLNRVVGEDREAFQPIIRVVEVGMRIDLRPELRGERSVWLDCQLELSHIVDVDLSTFVGLGDSLSTLQVPDVETTRVNAAADIPLGKTLLIGGLKTRDSEGNPQSMLVMLSPTNVTPVAAKAAEPVLCQRVYQVADLVVPIPGQVGVSTVPDATARQPAEFEADFDSLIELITSTLSPETWDKVGGAGSVAPVESNWSLVISQTEEVHEGIVDLFEQLRRLQDVQIVLDVELVDLPREIVEKLGIDVGSEEGSPALSSREARLLRALVEESASAGIRRLSKIALFNGQRGDVSVQDQGGRSTDETDKIVLQPVVSDDRRDVRLTIVLNPDGPKGSTIAVSVADGQTLVHEVTDQLSAVIEETRGVAAEPIPGFFRGFRRVRDDAENRQKFLLVTPTVVIREEEEERLGSVTPWSVIIQEEEEEMLGFGPF
ncbi:MAG: hypothetical protein HQ582_29585, partial [Planctomycetes bacterium]|nr:hypothetical protein [Planctomycetota bacterium]